MLRTPAGSALRSPAFPLIAPRLETSAPEQNAGGAPVTTTAPTPSSASMPAIGVHDELARGAR